MFCRDLSTRFVQNKSRLGKASKSILNNYPKYFGRGGGVNPISDFLFMISIHALNHAKMQRKQGILALVFAWSF